MESNLENLAHDGTMINVLSSIKDIIVNYLVQMSQGNTTLDQFLQNSQEVDLVVGNYSILQNRIIDSLTQLNMEREDRTREVANLELQILEGNQPANPEVAELLTRALAMLIGEPVIAAVVEAPVVEAPVAPPVAPIAAAPVAPIAAAPVTGLTEEVENTETSDTDDFDDFEDPDLVSSPAPTSIVVIVKNPEINENFVSIEDATMVMFVYVRYSHLPYHYSIDGVRYKLVLNGSDIISTVV